MIFVSHALPVNVPDEPRLDRQNVWDGLVLKANNALPFVPSMTFCEVTERHSDTVFDRDIALSMGGGRGERFTERITLEAPYRVTFTRIAGPVLGTIANEIESTDDGDLTLRFSFALVIRGVAGGSAEEQAYADSMTGDYLQAVAATLNAMRRLAEAAIVG
jgi:hypothetical protein